MIKKQLLLALLLLCFYSLHAQNQEMIKRLDALMATYSSLNQYSGTVALAHEGKILYQKSFGLADQEKKRANANNSLYNIGSIGKMFTSVAILQLVKERKLKLDAPISQYLSSYNLPNADKITPFICSLILRVTAPT